MKKIILTISAFMVASLASQAFVDNMYMTTPQYLHNTGYSAEAARMAGITNRDPYRDLYKEPSDFKGIIRRTYNYISPISNTDLNFYDHDGNFNNPSWKDL